MSEPEPWWREHTALLLTGLVSLCTGLKLIVVSGGSQTVALAMLRETSTPTVLLGLLVVSAPSWSLNLHTWCVAQVVAPGSVLRRVSTAFGLVASGFTFVVLLRASSRGLTFMLALDTALILALVLMFHSTGRFWTKKSQRLKRALSDLAARIASIRCGSKDRRDGAGFKHELLEAKQQPHARSSDEEAIGRIRKIFRSFLTTTDPQQLRTLKRLVGATAPLLLMSVAIVDRTPWLPSERLVTSTRTVVGYVLADNDRELVVLTHDQRSVVRLASADVALRELCRVRAEPFSLTRPSDALAPCEP